MHDQVKTFDQNLDDISNKCDEEIYRKTEKSFFSLNGNQQNGSLARKQEEKLVATKAKHDVKTTLKIVDSLNTWF